jgi:hypothetical protein
MPDRRMDRRSRYHHWKVSLEQQSPLLHDGRGLLLLGGAGLGRPLPSSIWRHGGLNVRRLVSQKREARWLVRLETALLEIGVAPNRNCLGAVASGDGGRGRAFVDPHGRDSGADQFLEPHAHLRCQRSAAHGVCGRAGMAPRARRLEKRRQVGRLHPLEARLSGCWQPHHAFENRTEQLQPGELW